MTITFVRQLQFSDSMNMLVIAIGLLTFPFIFKTKANCKLYCTSLIKDLAKKWTICSSPTNCT